ncbi:MAG TPA: glycosyltransferase family 1 protein [Candidatus Fermentibacter daniensis]|nr:MAG: hypothetical protein AO396_08995 [Candidatus Fermentibacter daniensis]HOD18650.1 glycosyltransferase family 1 protein [Candidatus Fermentibacter daniensis]HOG54858.1 glycosyltransferase family 1 protein [Candidatus Fermentibacter daniensis]HPH39506.1 glycosyltransferase family 1 protein [Candidatus Fermentibacter daniensis]HPN62208.1 glycosyltransferase family 1 protein [Candidatus Fermentibacter daniensis]
MMLEVALDVTVAAHALGGVGRYTLGLASALEEHAGGFGASVSFLDVPAARRGTRQPLPGALTLPDPPWTRIRGLAGAGFRLGVERATRAARIARISDADVFHVSGVQPESPVGRPRVLTFFDPSALEHPEWHTAATVRYAAREAALVRRGASLMAISEWSAARAREIFGPSCRITVAGGAADPCFTPGDPSPGVLDGLGLERQGFLLHVGNFVPRKNIPMLIEARARAAGRGFSLPLVLAGAGGWKEPGMEAGGVTVLREVSDETLLSLYRGARALLLPSEYEGLGLPALEAMACGCGVVAADSTALPETLAGCGLLLPPHDPDAWADAMTALESGSLAEELRSMALGRRGLHGWREVAAAACECYLAATG